MTTQELKEYINSKLGNSLRTLLPSYWWKRLFGLVVDRVDEVEGRVLEVPELITSSLAEFAEKYPDIESRTFYIEGSTEKNVALLRKVTEEYQNGIVQQVYLATLFNGETGKLIVTSPQFIVTSGFRFINVATPFFKVLKDVIINEDGTCTLEDAEYSVAVDTSKFATITQLQEVDNTLSDEIDGLKDSKQNVIEDLAAIRSGAALGATALQSYTEQYKGTVTGIKVNGSTHNPSNGVVDLGTISANESLRIHFEPNFDLEIGQHIDVTSLVQQSMGITPAELYEEVVTNGKKTALFIHELMGGELQEISRVIDSLYEGVGLSYLSTLDGLPSPFQLIISTTQCQLVIVDMLAGYNSVVVPLTEMVEGKQEQLVSGTNIKTINGESILGSGDITVSVDLDGFINQEDLANYHKYQSPYVVDWSADQSGTISHPGYYYFSDPTYLNLSGLPANPMGVYSIVLDNFSEDSSLNIVYPTNFRWTNGEPDFASLSGTTSVLELSILVLNDTDTVSNRKVLATWAIF